MIRTESQPTSTLRMESSSQLLAYQADPDPTKPATRPDSISFQRSAKIGSRPSSMGSQQLSTAGLSTSISGLTLVLPDHLSTTRPSPDRYRRSGNSSGASSLSLPQESMKTVSSRSSRHRPPSTAHPCSRSTQDDGAPPRPNVEQSQNARTPNPPPPREKNCSELSPGVKRTGSTRSHDAGAWWVSEVGAKPQSLLLPTRESSKTETPSHLRPGTAADTDGLNDTVKAPSAELTTESRAVLNGKTTRGVRSRLRKTFSFDSNAELLNASTENAFLTRSQWKEEGTGANAGRGSSGIYLDRSDIFSGSTDNVSISSTASSASVMLRKMGKSMKKGRSLRDIFIRKRAAKSDAVEEEREQLGINASTTEHTLSGSSFSKLECNSLGASSLDDKVTAKPIPITRKGILKKPLSDSQLPSPFLAGKGPSLTPSYGTPASSMPSTPREINLGGSNYFLRSNHSSSSLPNMPPRNITFNSRIELHRAWSSSEYDRRGDVWTADKITPQLAQAIKAEINSYKMHEMVVHESSKSYTQFYA